MGNTVGSRPPHQRIDPVTTDSALVADEMVIPEYDTSTPSHAGFSQINDQQFGAYVSGYVDGEGSFSVSLYRRNRLQIGWEVRPSFSVCQKHKKAEVLGLMLQYFNCGSIRNCITDDVDHYEVRRIDDLLQVIIPHFEHFPLLSARQANLQPFKNICLLVKAGQHLKHDGLKKITQLIAQMDVSTRRKHSLEAIAASLI